MEMTEIQWSREFIGVIQIITAVLFFGVSFIFQRYAMLHGELGPISYNACRYVVSTFLLYVTKPCTQSFFHSEVDRPKNNDISDDRRRNDALKLLWLWGTLCGLASLGGSLLQQIGIVTVTAGKTGFITGMFVIFVPIVEYFTPGFGGQLTLSSWISVIVSFVGLFLLSGCASQSSCLEGAVGRGEVIVFISMLFWVLGIMWSDIGCKRVDVISLTTVDFFVTTVFTVILAFVFEPQFWHYPFDIITANWLLIVVVGFTEAVAFALSTLGQMYTTPTRASLLFSMESVSCAVLSYLFLGETLTSVELLGCVLMTGSALYASLSESVAVEEEEQEVDGAMRQLEAAEEELLKNRTPAASDRIVPPGNHRLSVELVPILREHVSFGSTQQRQQPSP